MYEYLLTPQMNLGIAAGTFLLAGMLMGTYRLLKLVWGYENDRLFGIFQQGKTFVITSGILPLSIIRMGTFAILSGIGFSIRGGELTLRMLSLFLLIWGIFGLLQLFVARPLAAILPVHRLGGKLGGIIGGLSAMIGIIAFIVPISTLLFPTLSEADHVSVGMLSGFIGLFVGAVVGGKLGDGELSGTRIGETCEPLAREIAGWFILFGLLGSGLGISTGTLTEASWDAIVGGMVGVVAGMLIGIFYGTLVVLELILARMLGWWMYVLLKSPLLLLVFKTIVCQTCLRFTFPLRSRYDTGIRYCEHCGNPVDFTRIPGSVVATFGNVPPPSGKRLFVLSDPDFEEKEQPIDLAEVCLDPATTDKRLFERFLTYIVNYPPKDGVASIRIVYQGKLAALGDHLKNALRNTFTQIEEQQTP